MKHIVVGDLHGRDYWQQLDIRQYEKVVFIGDYVDSFTIDDEPIYQNLKSLIKLKKNNWNKVELLLGNHDVQYLHFPRYQINGFRPSMQTALTDLYYKNQDCFTMAYQRSNFLFTHAGVTNSWWKEFLKSPVLREIREDNDNIAQLINKVEATKDPIKRYMLYSEGFYRGVPGDMGYGSNLWADKKETIIDMLTGYHQIVGHNQVAAPETIRYTQNSITYIDVLSTMVYFHEIDC